MEQLWRVFGSAAVGLLALVPVGAAVVCVLAWVRARRMRRRDAWLSALLDVALVAAFLPVLYLVFVPVPGLEGRMMISLAPGAGIVPIFGGDGGTPARSALMQALGNIALLAPLAALVPLRISRLRSVPKVVLAALLLSVGIECAQWLLQLGRVSATDDVLLNTFGAALGASATRHWWKPRRAQKTIDQVRGAESPTALLR